MFSAFKGFVKNAADNTQPFSSSNPYPLAGDWVPTRFNDWYNNWPGKHSKRAADSTTKMTYDTSGHGTGSKVSLSL